MYNPYLTFPYVKVFKITANHPGVGYQIALTIPYTTGMKADFSDLRFYDNINETIINYWIDPNNTTNGSSAKVWIKLLNTDIFAMRWGDSSATSLSNGANVFDIYDDCSSWNSTIWGSQPSQITVSDGKYVWSTVSTGELIKASNISLTQGYVAVFRKKTTNALSSTQENSIGWSNGTSYQIVRLTNTATAFLFQTNNGGTRTSTNTGTVNLNYHTYEIARISDSSAKITIDGTTTYTNTTTIPTGNLKLYLASYKETVFEIDLIYVRKYIATQPTIEEYTIPYYPIIQYNEENEMFQIVNTTKWHPVQIRSLTTNEVATSITGTPTFTVSINGQTSTAPVLNYSTFDATMLRFLVEVPNTLATSAYDSIEINIHCADGDGFMLINVVPDPTSFATVNNITALNDLSSSDITTATLNAITSADVIKELRTMLISDVTGLTSGDGSPITFTGQDGSIIVYTVDANGNRTISSVTLV